MKRSEISKQLSRLHGFQKAGAFYIGLCNDDVISGYCLDASPNNIYLWKFILPCYDNLDFLHLSLGERIFSVTRSGLLSDGDDVDVKQFLNEDWAEFSKIKDRGDILNYLEMKRITGIYAVWVRYLTFICNEDFGKAEEFSGIGEIDKKFKEFPIISGNYSALRNFLISGNYKECSDLLGLWRKKMKAKFC
jgi:hypothetical protein